MTGELTLLTVAASVWFAVAGTVVVLDRRKPRYVGRHRDTW